MRTDIPLTICGEKSHAKTDICVVGADDILLLVRQDKGHKDAEPQLIAEATAAFQTDNTRRTRVLGQDTIDAKIMPGITLVGSSPTFLSPRNLRKLLHWGAFPSCMPIFLRCLAPLAV